MLVWLAQGRAVFIAPGVEAELQVLRQGLGEAGLRRQRTAGKAEQQLRQPIGLRQGAEGVEPQADLGLLELAEVAIGRIEPAIKLRGATERQFHALELLGQGLAQGASPFTAELTGLPILIQQHLKSLQCAMQACPSEGRCQVIEDHRLAAALGLGTLAGIVDDEGIKVWQGP